MPDQYDTTEKRVYRALVIQEKSDLTWDEAIRRWCRADNGRSVADEEAPEWAVEQQRARQTVR